MSEAEENRLVEVKSVKFEAGDSEEIKEYLRRFPMRWSNTSHFIRAAVAHYKQWVDAQAALEKKELDV